MPTRYFETASLADVLQRCTPSSMNEATVPSLENQSESVARRRTVLIVDDERIIADTLVAILNESGFSALAAYDGSSALDVIRSGVPDLLITDVSMPGMNGIDLAVAVRDSWPQCKILLFSGHAATTSLLQQAHDRGYDFDFLSKPVHPRDLLERLAG